MDYQMKDSSLGERLLETRGQVSGGLSAGLQSMCAMHGKVSSVQS
jgi:hypothetical protein